MPTSSAPRPLDDIRVIDLSQNLAGPYCTQILGDLGADVVKVEPPGGDPARAWGPPFAGEDSTLFVSTNRGKRSITIDLRAPGGADLVARLASTADVFVQSLRAGVAESLDLGPDRLRAANRRLVYCSVTAYGSTGPLSELPGYDPLIQAHGGLMSVTGQPGTPARVGTSVIDMGTGLWCAIGILAALRKRDRTGEGAHVVSSLYETGLAWNAYHLLGYLAAGYVPLPRGTAFPLIAPYEAFPTADGQLMIAAANDGLFRKLCIALGREDLARDPRYRDNPSRVQHRETLIASIAAKTRALTMAALTGRLRSAGVPCAPILDMAHVAAEPQTEASGLISEIDGQRTVLPPLSWDDSRVQPKSATPALNAHCDEVLAELGLSAEEIANLRASRAIL